MTDKTIKIIVFIVGGISLLAFVAVRYPVVLNVLIKEKVVPEYWENTKYGELYYFNYIDNFKEENLPPASIKYRFTTKHPKLNDADILTFGDSYLDFARMTTFPERLGDTLNKKVFYARDDSPLKYLGRNNYSSYHPRIIIYETAERYIPSRFSFPQADKDNPDNRSSLRKMLANFRDDIFLKESEIRYDLLLSRSYLTWWIYSRISTLKFNLFGYIPSTTPVYALNQKDPWLFYYEEVDNSLTGFYHQFTDSDINIYCDNIADLHKKLKTTYNLDMIFMPIPSKYTIYHKFLNNDSYNNLLPRIYDGLAKRNIPVIKLYDDFIGSDKILFYGTDTHWNKNGVDIALDKALDCVVNKEDSLVAIRLNPNNINKKL